MIKYHVDKNNLIFVYCKKFESGGRIRSTTRNLMIFNLGFYLIVTYAFYALRLGNGIFRYLGLGLFVFWFAVLYTILRQNPDKMKAFINKTLKRKNSLHDRPDLTKE